jgi:hypothetical protein
VADIEFPGYGQIAYEAYVAHCGGVSVRGEQLSSWDGQSPEIRAHWDAAAQAVADYLNRIPR